MEVRASGLAAHRAAKGQERHALAPQPPDHTPALADPTDDLFLRARSLLDLAETLRLLDRTEEVAGLLDRATELAEAKGDVVTAARTRADLARTTSAAPGI